MSILFVLLMFLLVLTISYFFGGKERPKEARPAAPLRPPEWRRELGFEIPQGYYFHPGHAWIADEGKDTGRVGLDSFAAGLLGKLDHIAVAGEQRWVRQGQKLMTLSCAGGNIEVLSPLEGVVTTVNPAVLLDPGLAMRDPYKDGWVCRIKSPEMSTNLRNLVQGVMVAPWMQNSITRLTRLVSPPAGATAQDGGVPIHGVLERVSPELRRKLVSEFFLT